MIYILLANGFEEVEALTFVDIIRRAGGEIQTVSVTADNNVVGAHSIKVITDKVINEIDDNYNALVLPGGMPGTTNLMESKEVARFLSDANKKNLLIGAICAAPMVLGKLGLLNGKNATCYPSFEKYLTGANIKEDRVVVSENIITSRGAGTAHDFALAFTEKLFGKDKANEICSSMLYY